VPFLQTHLDAVTTAANDLTTAKAQHDAAKTRLDRTLESLSAGLAEGDIRCLTGPVAAVTKVGGVVKYVIVPGLLDAEGATTP
jgi:hypothetical protein